MLQCVVLIVLFLYTIFFAQKPHEDDNRASLKHDAAFVSARVTDNYDGVDNA